MMGQLQERYKSYRLPQKYMEAGVYPYFREITSKQGPVVTMGGHKVLMFGSNAYNGLTGDDRIIEAAKKAAIHDFIMSLPQGYDTKVGELGDTLSSGEKQRIGIARAFLHDSQFILLDEPTSNVDSLNEGIILKSLKESAQSKTVVLVSHRESTMNVADVVYEMSNGRLS